ncbi:MAG: SDR family NAD(P)-dependent oxidoreductase [Lautropia sp.]
MNDLASRNVLVTGGSTGIGAAAASAFGAAGARVMIHYNASSAAAAAVAAQINDAGGNARIIGGDVTDLDTVSRIVAETADEFGGIDVLVNNVGSLVKRTLVSDYTVELLDQVLDINVRQMVWFVHEVAPIMRRGGGGSIINTTSIAARHGGGPGSVLYAAAKGFVSTATRGWARELAPDRIRVNAISPGVILTPFHERYSTAEQLQAMQSQVPMNRLGTPDECAATFLHLASTAASGYITGQIIEINGGQLMP